MVESESSCSWYGCIEVVCWDGSTRRWCEELGWRFSVFSSSAPCIMAQSVLFFFLHVFLFLFLLHVR